MITNNVVKLSVLLSLLFLSGCSSLSSKNDTTQQNNTAYHSAQDRALLLTQVTQWQVSGKIAYIEKDERNSATLSWQVNEDNKTQTLNLTSYLGINVLKLTSEEGLHALTFDGKTYYDTNLQMLIYSLTGMTLPITALNAWLKGLPYQDTDSITYNVTTQLPNQLTSTYDQSFWKVRYDDYKKIDQHFLATKLTITKGNLLIKLSIKKWHLSNNG